MDLAELATAQVATNPAKAGKRPMVSGRPWFEGRPKEEQATPLGGVVPCFDARQMGFRLCRRFWRGPLLMERVVFFARACNETSL